MKFSVRLFVAQGFGIGRIPFAPGTFGSVLGMFWAALLIAPGNPWVFLIGTLAGIAASVWLCGAAEKILGRTDPGSVVLDEIAAIPICFVPWALGGWINNSLVMPPIEALYSGHGWILSLGIFVLFRLFDIWKPWPIRQLQSLHGGWGVTVDDLLAAVYVALCTIPFIARFRYAAG